MVPTLRTPLGLKGHRPVVGQLDCEALVSVCGALHPVTGRLTTRLVERRNAYARGPKPRSRQRHLHAAFARHVQDIARAYPTGQYLRAVLVVDNAPWHQGPLVTAALKAVPQIALSRLGLGNGYAPHAMRTTFMTTALESGAKLEDVQRTVGHADPATTQLYDRRRFLPTPWAALMVAC